MLTLLATAVPTGAHRVIDSVSTRPHVLPLVLLIVFIILGICCFFAMFEEGAAFFGLVLFGVLAWVIPFVAFDFTYKAHHRNDVIAVVVRDQTYWVPAIKRLDGSWVPEEAILNGKQSGPPHIDPRDDGSRG